MAALSLLIFIPSLISSAYAGTCHPQLPSQLKNLVTFGDSYTDEGRLTYMFANNLTLPPAGTLLPPSNTTASGGLTWPRIVSNKSGLKSLNYAISSSSCSPDIVKRSAADFGSDFAADIPLEFPTIFEDQLPYYLADLRYPELYVDGRNAENTVYTVWVGGNDLGIGGFLNGFNEENTTLASLVECNFAVLDEIYNTGGRQFVVFGTHPLHVAPMYLPEEQQPEPIENSSWPPISSYGLGDYNTKMREYAVSTNTMLMFGIPYQRLEGRWPGATVSFFDAQQLIVDIVTDPGRYVKEQPVAAGIEMFRKGCRDFAQLDCDFNEGPLGRYVWYDELHPSERVEEIIAEEFIKVLGGESKYGESYPF
ncbi:hypothetical protein BDW74DRAFT_181571 [Aspergillus multicolor]|uniref:uncharacterized protein n=1 Tax=Aspergillus multicolor TaxID=41759 RepID=UPI003CCD31C7